MRYWTTLLLMTTAAAAYALSLRRNPDVLVAPLESIPARIDGWTQTAVQSLDEASLEVLRPTSYLSRTYGKDGQELGLFVTYYAEQRAGESMHSPRNCLPGGGWEIWKLGSETISLGPSRAPINKYSIQRSRERLLMLYWYQSRKRITASEYLGKLMVVKDSLFEGQTGGSMIRVIGPDRPDSAPAMLSFAAAVAGHVQRCLGH
jgi:EpsI family protein